MVQLHDSKVPNLTSFKVYDLVYLQNISTGFFLFVMFSFLF